MHKWNKLFIIGTIAMMLGCSGCGSSMHTAVRGPDPLHKHIGSSTVALVKLDDSGDAKPFCTGVWVSDTEILTAGHCVAHEEEDGDDSITNPIGDKIGYVAAGEAVEVYGEVAAVHFGKVVAFSYDDGDDEGLNGHDLALIKAIPAGVPPHEVVYYADIMPGIGEAVFSVGHPKGMYWTYATGTVAAYREITPIGKAIQANIDIWFGNSGGGLFDKSGNLLGICSRLSRVPGMNIYVHLDQIKLFIRNYKHPAKTVPTVVKEEKKVEPAPTPITFHIVPAPAPRPEVVPQPDVPRPGPEALPPVVPEVTPTPTTPEVTPVPVVPLVPIFE